MVIIFIRYMAIYSVCLLFSDSKFCFFHLSFFIVSFIKAVLDPLLWYMVERIEFSWSSASKVWEGEKEDKGYCGLPGFVLCCK